MAAAELENARITVPIATPARPPRTTVALALPAACDALARCLEVLGRHQLDLAAIASTPRPSRARTSAVELAVSITLEVAPDDPRIAEAACELAAHASAVEVSEDSAPLPPTAVDDTDPDLERAGRSLPLVTATVPTARSFARVGRAVRDAETVVDVGGVSLGGPNPPVFFAGPLVVETRAQIRACARAAKDAGAQVLWGGCFEARASHHFVEGLGFDALDLLEAAARDVGLPFATEVAAASDVGKVARRVDLVICGERHLSDTALLAALGQIDKPVLLKRGAMASIDEWLRAAETIADHGNPDVVLCERGARSLDSDPAKELSSIATLREITSLPIVIDPTQSIAVRRRIQPLAQAALAAGANGIVLEIHPEPANALGGGNQALTFEMFRTLMHALPGGPIRG